LMVDRLRLPGVEQVTLMSSPIVNFSVQRAPNTDVLSVTDGYDASDLAMGILNGNIEHAVAAQQLIWTRSGWPWLALESRAQCDATNTDRYASVTWGIPLPIKPGTAGIPVLPLRPVWPGFALSTAAWMCMWAVPIVFVPSLRVYLRYAGARCWHCGYELRVSNSDVCPECGTSTRHSRGPALALIAARCRPLWRPRVRFVLCILLGLVFTVLMSMIATRRIAAFWPAWPSGYVGIHPKATIFDPLFADTPVMIYGCECRVPGARRVRLAINYTASQTQSIPSVLGGGDPNAPLETVVRGRDCAAMVRAIELGEVSLVRVAGVVEWYETGWPFFALSFKANPVPSPTLSGQPIYGGIRFDWPNILAEPIIIPCTPMWSGLIGNVLVWSSLPLCLAFGVPWVVQKRRSRSSAKRDDSRVHTSESQARPGQ